MMVIDDSGCTTREPSARRQGATLLVCLFTIAFSAVALISMLESVRLQVASQASTIDYERANYLAGAGVHHAMSQLQEDMGWRVGVPVTNFDGGAGEGTYWATVAENADGTLLVTGYGTAGGVTRTLKVTIE